MWYPVLFPSPNKALPLGPEATYFCLLSLNEIRDHMHRHLYPQWWYTMIVPNQQQVTRHPAARWIAHWEDEMIRRKIKWPILPSEVFLRPCSLPLPFSQEQESCVFNTVTDYTSTKKKKNSRYFKDIKVCYVKANFSLDLMWMLITKDPFKFLQMMPSIYPIPMTFFPRVFLKRCWLKWS